MEQDEDKDKYKEVAARPISSPNQTRSTHVSQPIVAFNLGPEGAQLM